MNISEQKRFKNVEEFLEETKNIETATRRNLHKARALQIKGIKKLTAEQLVKNYNMSMDLAEEAKRHCSYIVKIGTRWFPLSSLSKASLQERAGVAGQALDKLRPEQYSRVLNTCLKTTSEKSTIVFYNDVVLAFLSQNYKILKIDEIYSAVDDKIKSLNGKFVSGETDIETVSALYKLPLAVTQGYKHIIPDTAVPVVSVRTSNIGLSGANIFPLFEYKNSYVQIGDPLLLQHKGNATIDLFKENIDQIYALYQKSLKAINDLKSIRIDNPLDCLINVAQQIKIPKKYLSSLLVDFQVSMKEVVATTAYDVYNALLEAIFYAKEDGKNDKQISNLRENLARVIKFNWKSYDYKSIDYIQGRFF